jgi:hypothetical protein
VGVVLGKLWLVVLHGQHLVMRGGVVSVLSSQVGCAPWEIVSLDSVNISCLGSEMVMTRAVRDNWSGKGWVVIVVMSIPVSVMVVIVMSIMKIMEIVQLMSSQWCRVVVVFVLWSNVCIMLVVNMDIGAMIVWLHVEVM